MVYSLIKASGEKQQSRGSSSQSDAGTLRTWHVKSFVIQGRWDQTCCCICLVLVWKTSGTSALYGFSSWSTFLFSLVVNTPKKWSVMNRSGFFNRAFTKFTMSSWASFLYSKKTKEKERKKEKVKITWRATHICACCCVCQASDKGRECASPVLLFLCGTEEK